MKIDGHVFVVTGAGSGIGQALSRALSSHGAKLVLADLNADGLKATLDTLDAPQHARIVVGDITLAETRQALIDTATSQFGGIDALINNAGVIDVGLLADANERALQLMLNVNVLAPMLLIRDLLPTLERSATPTIINVGSMFGDIAFPLFAGYSATKFAVRGLSDALRRELATKGITITYVAPRAAKTVASNAFEHLVEPMQMKLDPPEKVATDIVRAIKSGSRSSYPRGMERLFVFVQRVLPAIIDNAVIARFKNTNA